LPLTLLPALLVAFALAALAGCGGPETVEEPPPAVPSGQPEPVSQAGDGGTASVALPAAGEDPPGCYNAYLPECFGADALLGVVHEGALAEGPGGEHRPVLAEEVPSFEGGTLRLAPFVVEYRLRRGVRFSDGRPVTSADARATYEWAVRLAREGDVDVPYPGFVRLRAVETPDERTVRLRFGEPYAGWREVLSAPILPRGEASGRSPTGTGPFVPRGGAKPGEVLEFERNARYWVGVEPSQPRLDGLTVGFGGVGGRELDLRPLEPGEAPPAGARASRSVPPRVVALLPNSRRAALDQPEEREAVLSAAAPDRARLADLAGAPVADSLALLAGADDYVPAWEGAPEDGGRAPERPGELVLVYPQEGGERGEKVARAIVRGLGRDGIGASSRAVPPGEFYARTLPKGEFDLALVAVRTPSDLERLPESLPPESAKALRESLSSVEDDGESLAGAQRSLRREAALLPLYAPPDGYAWTGALVGPRPDTPSEALLHNVREWGFYR